MTGYLEDSQLIAYIHNMLTPEQMDQVEQAMRADETVRERLADLRLTQRVLSNGISAEIQSQLPPSSMSYSGIADEVKRRRGSPRQSLQMRWLSGLAALMAVFVLVSAVIYSIDDRDTSNEGSGARITVTVEEAPALQQLTPDATPSPTPDGGTATLPTRTPEPIIPAEEGRIGPQSLANNLYQLKLEEEQ